MFNNLQVESKLDIFKYLNIEQLTSVRQTNYYFNALIGRYEGELARKKFYKIEIIELFAGNNYKYINLQDGVFKLKATNQLMEKWHSVLDRQITVYLDNIENKPIVICKESDHNNFKTFFLLNLPIIPKNIEEIKIIRCWIEKISLCYFNYFFNSIFNPKLIQLIFENEEINKITFNGGIFNYSNIINESILLFYLNRLVINELFWVNLSFIDNTFKQQSINILFKFLLKIPLIIIDNSSNSALCKMMLNFIETSKDYSNMFNYIKFNCSWLKFNLNERAEFIRKEQGSVGWQYFYQLTNQNNPKVKFSILYIVRNELISHFKIVRIS